MTVRIDASGDNLTRTSNLIDYNSTYTFMMWLYIATDLSANGTAASINDTGDDFDSFGITNVLATRLVTRDGGGSVDVQTGSTISVGAWNHFVMVRHALDDIDLVLNGVVDATSTVDRAGRTASAQEIVGSQAGGAARVNVRVHAIKEYSTDLSLAEIKTEMNATRPIKLANLLNFTPILAGTVGRIKAYNGVDWTAGGTLTDEAPPPIGWGNSAILTPIVAAVVGVTGKSNPLFGPLGGPLSGVIA